MSRLKGADLGVSVPGAALNYRGDWSASPAPAYAVNDLVVRSGGAYVAALLPGANDPISTGVITQASSSSMGTGSVVGAQSTIQFSVPADTWVSALDIGMARAHAGGSKAGIASVFGAGTSVIPYLVSGLTTATAGAGASRVVLSAPILLKAGTTYNLVCEATDVAATTANGGLVTGYSILSNLLWGASFSGGSWGNFLPFNLLMTPWRALVPSGALNFRGAWVPSPVPPYAANDVVLRNGSLYRATDAPSQTADPLGAASSFTQIGAQSSSTDQFTSIAGGLSPYTKIAQPFQVSALTTVTAVQLYYGYRNGGQNTTGGQTVGIAAALGATVNYLGKGQSQLVGAGTNTGGSGTFDAIAPLDAPVTLQPGVTYYLVSEEQASGATNTPSLSGSITLPAGAIVQNATYPNFNGQATAKLPFALYTSPWAPVGGPGPGGSHRGAWKFPSLRPYVAGDVVTRNGALYLALGAAGSADPATGMVNLGAQTAFAGGPSGTTQIAQAFTVSQPTVVTQVKYKAASTGGTGGGRDVGIASAVGSVVNWISQGTSHAVAASAYDTVVLPAPAALQPGVTYYLICNETNSDGSTVPVATGMVTVGAFLFGANYASSSASYRLCFELDGSPWAPLSPLTEQVNTVAASGAATTLPDVSTATMHKVTLTANATITLPTPAAGKRIRVQTQQDATGARTLTWATPSGAIRWPGGTVPTVSAGANAIDVVEFYCVDGTNWFGHDLGRALA